MSIIGFCNLQLINYIAS